MVFAPPVNLSARLIITSGGFSLKCAQSMGKAFPLTSLNHGAAVKGNTCDVMMQWKLSRVLSIDSSFTGTDALVFLAVTWSCRGFVHYIVGLQYVSVMHWWTYLSADVSWSCNYKICNIDHDTDS